MIRSKSSLALIVCLSLLLAFAAGIYTARSASGSTIPEPGSAGDPLVSVSYMQAYVQEQLAKQAGSVYTVVNLNAGQFLQAGAGTEIILRAGNAEAVGNHLGDGISNVTSGQNLAGGAKVPLNHLLIVPRDDGRGVKALAYGGRPIIFMVRGEYIIK